jgi:hypothetical protein
VAGPKYITERKVFIFLQQQNEYLVSGSIWGVDGVGEFKLRVIIASLA